MAATQTEGMVAVVRGAGEAGVAVTLLNGNKQYTLTPTETSSQNPTTNQRAVNPQIPTTYQGNPVRNPPLLQTPYYPQQQQPLYNYNTCPYQYQGPPVAVANKVNAGMVTDQRKMVKCDSAVQACDGRYTSTYRRHHCHVAPTSPEPLPTEFPAQKPNLRPGTGHFVVGGSGSGETHQTATKSSEYRGGPMNWPDRDAVCCPQPRNHPDAFVSSLRKYPLDTICPDRSSEIVERLINYTQTKNTTGKTHCHSTSRISNVEAFNLRKSLFSQNYGQSKNAYEEFRARSPVRGATGRSYVEKGFGNERRSRNDDSPYLGFNRNPDVRFKLNMSPNRRVTIPTQRNNKESYKNPAIDTDKFPVDPSTSKNKQLAQPTVVLDVVEEIETDTVQTTASYTDLSHNLPDHSVRRTKSFEVILTDSAEKFRREILGCFQGISLIPSRDPKERLLRQGLLKKLTRKLNKLCEIYKSRYKEDKVPELKSNHKYPAPRIPVVCDKNNFGATLKTIIEPSISVTKRHDTKVYLVEVPESSRAFNNFSSEFNRTVASWLDSIEMYGQRQERQEILEHFLTRLKMVFADRPTSQAEFREMLKAEIVYLLDCVPLSTETNRVMYKHRYTELLLNKLLPTSSVEIRESKYEAAQVHQSELKKIVSAELGYFLQDMRVEVYDHRYLEYVKKDLYEILCDALTDIFTGSTEEIHTDLVIFLQESLSVTEVLADEMAHSMIASIRNVRVKDKTLLKVKSNPSLTKTSGNFLVYVSRSQDKFGGHNDSIETVSVFEPSRDISNDTQGNIPQYQHDVSIQIDEWLNSLHIANIPNKSQAVNELAADIVDRKRYLELNLSAQPPNNDIDYLKYQIFKWINKSVSENNQATIANASGLMKKIQSIPVPDLQTTNQSTANSRRSSLQQNEACRQCCSSKQFDGSPENDFSRIENMLLGWLTATPLYRNRKEEQDEQERVIKKLAQSIGQYKNNSDLSKTDAELSMVNMIIQHIKALPLDNGKHFCCMRSSIVEATARNLNECLEKGIFSASPADHFSVSDVFLINTIEDWIRGLPFEPFKNAAEAQSFRARQEDFIQRLKNSRTSCCSRKKIIADIESFLMFMPFDCGKKCDARFLNSEIIKLLQMLEVVPLEEVNVGGGYDSFMSGLGPTSSKDDFGSMTSSRSGVTFNTMPPHIRDMIDQWTQGLPIKGDTPQEKALAEKARKAMAKELARQIDKLANDPRAVADRFYLEDMLEPVIDKLLDSLPQSPELSKVRHASKVALLQAIGDHFATLKRKPKFLMAEAQSNKSIDSWVESLPVSPESKRDIAIKIKSAVSKVFNHPNLGDNPAMLDKFLDQEIDNILDSLPQTPELRTQREQLKQKLKKDLVKALENAHAEQKVDEYKDALGNAISSVIPNDNPSVEVNKQKLLDIMVDLKNPFTTPEEKREALDNLDKIIDEIRAASPILMGQPREEVKRRIMDALNKVPPPDKITIGILKKRKGSLSAPQMQSLDDSLAKILPYTSSQRQAMEELGLENLVDDYVDRNYKGNNDIEKLAYKEALLDKIVKVLEDIAKQGISMDIHTLKGKILDAMKTVSLPGMGAHSCSNYRDTLKQKIRNSLPPHKLGSTEKEAEFELLLDDILDNKIKIQHPGNGEPQKAAIKQKMDNSMKKLLGLLEKEGVKLSPDTMGTILTAINNVPTPNIDILREHQKEIILKEEISAWVNKLPLKPAQTPQERLERNREIEGLVQTIIDAEQNAGPYGNPEELKKKEILKWLNDCPSLIKTGFNAEKAADELLNNIKNNQVYNNPDAPMSSGAAAFKETSLTAKIPEQFKKAADDLHSAVADWCDEIPLPAGLSPAESEEAKIKARETGNKLVSKINEALADPKIRDDSFLFQSIAEDEIDNMLEALPQSPELQTKKEELKRNLMKKFNDFREKAKGEHAVHDYGKKVDTTISNILPSQYDNPDIIAAKEKLADTFKELMFEPLSTTQKKKSLKKFYGLVDEIYDATPSLQNQPKEQARRRLLNALKKIPPPPRKFMVNELAESKLKREVLDFFHDLKVKPQSKEDKEHVNKIKSALAKVLHDIENRVPADSEEYDKHIKDALNKWAHKLPLTSDQESQLTCLIDKFVDKLRASNRKRRDDLAAHLNEDEESASDEEEAVCWKCKQKIGCRRPLECRPPSIPCMRPSNIYIPPQCYMPPPDCYIPPPQPCFKPPDCYSPLPDCYKQPEYNKPPESNKAREYSRPPEANRQPDCNKQRECFRQPDGGRPPVKRPHPGPSKKPAKFQNCRRTNSPMASMNPHHCYFTPPFCPRCYALGHPCNEHR